MKKSFILLALTSTLLVTGCQQSRDKFEDHFKEYSFKGVVSNSDEQLIYEGQKKGALKVSSVEEVEESYSNSGYVETSSTQKTKIIIKEDKTSPDNLIVEKIVAYETSIYDNGVSYKESSKSEIKAFDRNGRFYTVTAKTENGKTTKKSSSEEINMGSLAYKEAYLTTNFGNFTSSAGAGNFYYRDDGTYAYVFSSINKRVAAEQWGNETKEWVVTNKYQTVYFFDKEYKVTSVYSYNEKKTNRNPATNEWYSSEQLISRNYHLAKFKYDKRENASLNSLVEYMNKK